MLQNQKGWIHELARAEVHPEAEKLLQLGSSFDSQQLVEESTIGFLTELRDCFTQSVRTFNAYSEGNTRFQEVKIYTIAQTVADFMIFRNQIKLVISNSAHGVIQLSYSHHQRASLAVNGQSQPRPLSPPQEILARLGPFRTVDWVFQGEKVSPEQVAKFNLTEFVRATRDMSRSRSGKQLLLKEIQTFLEEKGFDI